MTFNLPATSLRAANSQRFDALGGFPTDGPVQYTAYSRAVALEGNTLKAFSGAYGGIAFGLLGKRIPANKDGALLIDFSRGAQIILKNSPVIGDEPFEVKQMLAHTNSEYLAQSPGFFAGLPQSLADGYRVRFAREGDFIKALLGPTLLYSFPFQRSDSAYFHANFYVEAPSVESTLSNPYGVQLVGL